MPSPRRALNARQGERERLSRRAHARPELVRRSIGHQPRRADLLGTRISWARGRWPVFCGTHQNALVAPPRSAPLPAHRPFDYLEALFAFCEQRSQPITRRTTSTVVVKVPSWASRPRWAPRRWALPPLSSPYLLRGQSSTVARMSRFSLGFGGRIIGHVRLLTSHRPRHAVPGLDQKKKKTLFNPKRLRCRIGVVRRRVCEPSTTTVARKDVRPETCDRARGAIIPESSGPGSRNARRDDREVPNVPPMRSAARARRGVGEPPTV